MAYPQAPRQYRRDCDGDISIIRLYDYADRLRRCCLGACGLMFRAARGIIPCNNVKNTPPAPGIRVLMALGGETRYTSVDAAARMQSVLKSSINVFGGTFLFWRQCRTVIRSNRSLRRFDSACLRKAQRGRGFPPFPRNAAGSCHPPPPPLEAKQRRIDERRNACNDPA